MRIFVIVFTALLCAISGFTETLSGKIVKIADGDTVTLLTPNNEQIRIRLNCIDAPEKSQDFGQRSRQSLGNLLAGAYVKIKKHDVDKYGRVIGTIYLDGVDINLTQVKRGMAWVYDRYCSDPTYHEAEQEARSARLGLWSHPNPIEPWNYRRGKKEKNTNNNYLENSGYRCGEKKYCSQMSSCEEAMFYFTKCGLKKLDRDNDGKPCESICR